MGITNLTVETRHGKDFYRWAEGRRSFASFTDPRKPKTDHKALTRALSQFNRARTNSERAKAEAALNSLLD